MLRASLHKNIQSPTFSESSTEVSPKRKKRKPRWLLGCFLLLGFICILLSNSVFQQKILQGICADLNSHFGTNVRFDSISLSYFPPTCSFYGLCLLDSSDQAIIHIKRIDAAVRIVPMFLSKDYRFPQLRLIAPSVFLTDKNIDQLAHLFNKSPSSSFRLDQLPNIRLSSLVVVDGSFSYQSEASDYHLSKWRAKLSLTNYQGQLQCRLHDLSAQNDYGFVLESANMGFTYENGLLSWENSCVKLPHSFLRTDSCLLSLPPDLNWKEMAIQQAFVLETDLSSDDFPTLSSMLNLPATDEPLNLAASLKVEGDANRLDLSSFRFSLDDYASIEATATAKHLADPHQSTLSCYWKHLQIDPHLLCFFNGVSARDSIVELPDELLQLGLITYNGTSSLSDNKVSIAGRISTNQGTIQTTATASLAPMLPKQVNFSLHTKAFNLNELIGSQNDFGNVSFRLNGEARIDSLAAIDMDAQLYVEALEYRHYAYNDITANLQYDSKGVSRLNCQADDEHCRFSLEAQLDTRDEPYLSHALLEVDHFDLNASRWLDNPQPSETSFRLEASVEGSHLDEFRGEVSIDSFLLFNQGVHYYLPSLKIAAFDDEDESLITLSSELMDAELAGSFKLSDCKQDIVDGLVARYFPHLKTDSHQPSLSPNDYRFWLDMKQADTLLMALGYPISIQPSTRLEGYFDRHNEHFFLSARSEGLLMNQAAVFSPTLSIYNRGSDTLFLDYQGQLTAFGEQWTTRMSAQALQDSISLHTQWTDLQRMHHQSELFSSIRVDCLPDDETCLYAFLEAPRLFFGDYFLQIDPSEAFIHNKKCYLDHFSASHLGQTLALKGVVSNLPTDTLHLMMNHISLDEIFDMLPDPPDPSSKKFLLGGTITADAAVVALLEMPQVRAKLDVNDFSMNKNLLGNLDAASSWNHQDKSIEINALLSDNKQNHLIGQIQGGFCFANSSRDDSLYLTIHTQGIPVDFVSYFTDPILDLGGKAFGVMQLGMNFSKNQLSLQGEAYAREGKVGLKMLNSQYTFNDSIRFTEDGIYFNSIELSDSDGNKALLEGAIHHRSFSDFQFDLSMTMDRLKVIDLLPTSITDDMYGTVYASGRASLSGTDSDVRIDVNARTEDRSHFHISMMESSEVDEYAFIEFVHHTIQDTTPKTDRLRPYPIPDNTNREQLNIQLQLDVTPSAEVVLITDPNTGDEMRGRGSGTLRIVYDSDEDLAIYGRYELESGKYRFSIQDLMSRDFTINPGSAVNFSGDIMTSELDIMAQYTIPNVPLSDLLDESEIASMNLNRTSIPVSCTMSIAGALQHPGIQLGLDFPSADEELKRRIMNVINTDEILNQQIVYLMILNRFATTEYTAEANNTNNNMTAVVGMTLSSLSNQLNRLIYQAMGSDNLSLGINYRNDDLSADMGELQVAMTGKFFDDRLIYNINSNISTQENPVHTNSQLIGDFDIEYKLSQSGRLRIKMFNRANDSRYFNSGLNTQGAGVVYKQSFNSIGELFRPKKRSRTNASASKKK